MSLHKILNCFIGVSNLSASEYAILGNTNVINLFSIITYLSDSKPKKVNMFLIKIRSSRRV